MLQVGAHSRMYSRMMDLMSDIIFDNPALGAPRHGPGVHHQWVHRGPRGHHLMATLWQAHLGKEPRPHLQCPFYLQKNNMSTLLVGLITVFIKVNIFFFHKFTFYLYLYLFLLFLYCVFFFNYLFHSRLLSYPNHAYHIIL